MRIKYLLITALILISISSSKNYSQNKGFGLGVMIGEPTGLSGKYWLDETHAVDFGLAYSFVHPEKTFSLHADYLFHNDSFIHSTERLPVYYGIGARVHLGKNDGSTIGARGVAGIVWMPGSVPIDIFIELAPVFNLFPETSLHLDFAIGGRYYFGK